MRGIAEFLIHGRVGQDPEFSQLANGTARCRAGVCANIAYKDGEEWKENPTWFNFAWFGKYAELMQKRLYKGAPVVIRGDISSFRYEKDGREITGYNFRPMICSIVGKPEDALQRQSSPGSNGSAPPPNGSSTPTNGGQHPQYMLSPQLAAPPALPGPSAASSPPSSPPSSAGAAVPHSESEAPSGIVRDPFNDDDIPF
jgi:single stranded DNA-binding protein